MYCRVILIHLFVLFVIHLGASSVTGQVDEGDHNTMNVGGSGLALPVPLQLAPVSTPQPMQMSIQPIPMASMYQALPMATAPLPENFASQQMQHTYATLMLQDFAAHQQMPMSPITPDETRV